MQSLCSCILPSFLAACKHNFELRHILEHILFFVSTLPEVSSNKALSTCRNVCKRPWVSYWQLAKRDCKLFLRTVPLFSTVLYVLFKSRCGNGVKLGNCHEQRYLFLTLQFYFGGTARVTFSRCQ